MAIKYFILMLNSFIPNTLNNCINEADTNKVTVVGTAVVIKNHAAVRTDDSLIYYLDGFSNWDNKYKGKRVRVTGKPDTKQYPPIRNNDPKITITPQPRLRDGIYIKKAKWKLVKNIL